MDGKGMMENQLQKDREHKLQINTQEQQTIETTAFDERFLQLKQENYANQTAEPDSLALYREKTAEMKDTAELGGTSGKGKKSINAEKKEKIRRSKALTGKATAYTEEIHTQLAQVQQETTKNDPELQLRFLEQYRFTPQMFVSSNIRANFKEYVSLVNSYYKLQGLYEESEDAAGMQRLEALAPIVEAFTHRLSVYCEQNRVFLSGEILADKQKASQLTQQEIDNWYGLVSEYEPETAELPAAPEEQLTAEEMKQVCAQIHLLREDAEADPNSDPAWLEDLRLREQRYQAYYLLAAKKAELADGGDTAELEQTIRELQEDVRRLELRKLRMELGMPQAGQQTETVRRTREEAISTDSDMLSYQSRDRLAALNRSLQEAGGSPDTVALIGQYVQGTRYRVGYTRERENLQAARKAVEKALQQENNEQIRMALLGVKSYFDTMTNGTLVVPEGAEILDFRNKRPEEAGTGQSGSTRNALIRKLTYWSDQKDTPLFAHEPTVNDLKQRLVSNCYMMASVAGLVEFSPEILKSCIVDEGDSVVVRLYERRVVEKAKEQPEEETSVEEVTEGELQEDQLEKDLMEDIEMLDDIEKTEFAPIYVRVSKEIPRIAGADALSSGALWMQMIEKACAFVGKENVKGYQSLWYGEGGAFLERLLGISQEPVGMEDEDALFEEIRTAKERGYVYHAGSKGTAGKEDGLNGGHAYTVMGAKEIDGKKYILLRNPYSTFSLQYQENGEKTRTGDLINVSSDETYGQFYIEVSDFVRKFKRVTRTNIAAGT